MQRLHGVRSVHDGAIGVPNPTQWRDYFHNIAKLLFPASSSSAATQRHQLDAKGRHEKPSDVRRRDRTRIAGDIIFGSRLTLSEPPNEVFWNGKRVMEGLGSPIPLGTIVEILWDLHEHNFRLELTALDQCIMSEEWLDPATMVAREKLLREVFPGDGGCLLDHLPERNEGITAERWEDRHRFIVAFSNILSSWPCAQDLARMSILQAAGHSENSVTRQDVEILENLAVSLYCQTFFDWFARAPVTPHRLPQRLPSSSAAS